MNTFKTSLTAFIKAGFQLLKKHALMTAIFLIFVLTGFAGLDFGKHWDEWVVRWTQQEMVQTGNILPRSYLYPTMQHRVASLPLVPTMIKEAVKSATTKTKNLPRLHRERKTTLRRFAQSHRLHMITRGFFLLFSALGIIWIYLALLNLNFSKYYAALAASLYGLSWEVAYHARFMVGDTLMVQFAILALAALFYGYSKNNLKWFKLSAVAAAAAATAKYQGAIVLLPVAILLWTTITVTGSDKKIHSYIKQLFTIGLYFLGGMILFMPEIILDSFRVIEQFKHNMGLYSGGCYGYTIEPGMQHMTKNMHYLIWHLSSPYALPSLLLFITALSGIIPLILKRKWALLAALTTPPVILFFLFSSKKVMFVRNLLLIYPFLIILAVFAIKTIAGLLQKHLKKLNKINIPVILVAFFILLHGVFLINAAASINIKKDKPFLQELNCHISSDTENRYLITPDLYKKISTMIKNPATNMTTNTAVKTKYLVYSHETLGKKTSWKIWKANTPGITEKVFGPLEINYFYYTTWLNHKHRFVIVSKPAAWRQPYFRALFK